MMKAHHGTDELENWKGWLNGEKSAEMKEKKMQSHYAMTDEKMPTWCKRIANKMPR